VADSSPLSFLSHLRVSRTHDTIINSHPFLDLSIQRFLKMSSDLKPDNVIDLEPGSKRDPQPSNKPDSRPDTSTGSKSKDKAGNERQGYFFRSLLSAIVFTSKATCVIVFVLAIPIPPPLLQLMRLFYVGVIASTIAACYITHRKLRDSPDERLDSEVDFYIQRVDSDGVSQSSMKYLKMLPARMYDFQELTKVRRSALNNLSTTVVLHGCVGYANVLVLAIMWAVWNLKTAKPVQIHLLGRVYKRPYNHTSPADPPKA